jgi:hypothetical protein
MRAGELALEQECYGVGRTAGLRIIFLRKYVGKEIIMRTLLNQGGIVSRFNDARDGCDSCSFASIFTPASHEFYI